jgi:hypothetical protein
LAVKAALDQLSNKTAWLRWLKTHVHYSAKTAQHYMAVARLCEKTEALPFFLTLAATAPKGMARGQAATATPRAAPFSLIFSLLRCSL